jgi:hypothetical protein
MSALRLIVGAWLVMVPWALVAGAVGVSVWAGLCVNVGAALTLLVALARMPGGRR